ncbi:MAG: small ribosomal subunit biogenesis GTPase RsgA [Spirulinaceae cyanobacterium]
MSGTETTPEGLRGTVVAVQANFYQVRLLEGTVLLCTKRSRLKKINQGVMVGDRVLVEEPDWTDGRGVVTEVFPRRTELKRPPVANADQVLLVFALAEPDLDVWQLSRFLTTAEATKLGVRLGLNKKDLIEPSKQQEWRVRLQGWGYDPISISVAQDREIGDLWDVLAGNMTILAGPSGVGKSSLINRLIPAVDLRVGAVSGKLSRGRHTTRHVELFELPGGGLLADSPGFNKPNLECEPAQLAYYFPEARERLKQGQCQFSDCLHRDEPNCVVRGDWERYEHYLKFLEEVMAYQEEAARSPDEEATMKLKMSSSGQKRYEPRLETKKYRRQSRRSRHQDLQQIYEDASIEALEEDLEDFEPI